MLKPPPFKFASTFSVPVPSWAAAPFEGDLCCQPKASADAATALRSKLSDLDPQLHCSVIGTCLSTAELRKAMARFIDVRGASDLDVHHEAVRLTGDDPQVAKLLHKTLDKRHDGVVQRFARAKEPQELAALWDDALRQGEIPAAYWALLTHRKVTSDLRQRAFGEVHMLSHLVGAANRADIRRLVALERDNAEWRDRADRQQMRMQQLQEERDALHAQLQRAAADDAARQAQAAAPAQAQAQALANRSRHGMHGDTDNLVDAVALQTTRRERAESQADAAVRDNLRLQSELEHLRQHAKALGRELAAAEAQLQGPGDDGNTAARHVAAALQGRRVLYVGGRPSSAPAIRDLVLRHGGDFQRHDGGLEDRKGLLESSVAWAEFVLFPVDCIDHDSAGRLKRLCGKLGTPFVPLRSASVASFAAAVADLDDTRSVGAANSDPAVCLRHG